MPRPRRFEVEQWMDTYETTPGCINIAETCAASVSIDDLVALSQSDAGPVDSQFTSAKLLYGAIKGSDALRSQIASIHETELSSDASSGSSGSSVKTLTPEQVLIFQGAIHANFLTLWTYLNPGDHVICVYPTYQQLYSIPESVGAEVSLWKLKPENGFVPDVSELEQLVRPNTKMIIINNPNNPTGAVTPLSVLREIVAFAKARDIVILSDEVYRPLFHSLPSGTAPPPSITALGYENVIATGSMSKAYALAGIRIGWIASSSKLLLSMFEEARDYTTISVSQLDDRIAAYALSPRVKPALLRRNVALAQNNLALLSGFVERHSSVCDWVVPQAGTTAFIRFKSAREGGVPVDDVQFCKDVFDETRVFFVPGSKCFGNDLDWKGYVRIGYVSETEVLKKGLEKLGEYLKAHLYL